MSDEYAGQDEVFVLPNYDPMLDPAVPALAIVDADKRPLLALYRDGHVEGAIADASEAARIFVDEVNRLFGHPRYRFDQSDSDQSPTQET